MQHHILTNEKSRSIPNLLQNNKVFGIRTNGYWVERLKDIHDHTSLASVGYSVPSQNIKRALYGDSR